DEGRKALSERRYDEAEAAAVEALRLAPNEAQFHALRGDIDFVQERYDAAVAHYRDAIALDDNFFYYPLRKGLAHQRLRQWDAAQTELQRSVSMLPTADAYNGLGAIAEQRGDRATALELYAQAAGSGSPAGQSAQDAVVRL